jgi:hypothetical protein
MNDDPTPSAAGVSNLCGPEKMPRRLRAFLYSVERTLVGVAMKLLAWGLERMVLRASPRG